MNAAEDATREELAVSDVSPVCPRCGDVCAMSAAKCPACGARLRVTKRPRDRYVIRELTGYTGTSTTARASTEVMVLDGWDCYHVVTSLRPHHGQLAERQRSAGALARRLNEDHRRWLNAGRWT
jgi:hypothetical protein